MDYQFEIKDVEKMPVLCIKATCPVGDIGPTLGRILPKVFGSLVDLGVRPAGPPFCRYLAWREQDCDLEGGIIVDGLVTGVGEIEGAELGGCKAAYAVHQGSYSELNAAYKAMQAWMAEKGLSGAGAPFDVYITDPGKIPDPSNWRTEIYWPVQ